MRRPALLSLVLSSGLALAACGSKPAATDLNALDAALVDGNAGDPALTAALNEQIMVDPALTQSSNANAVRPPARPDPQAVPQDSGTGGKPVGKALTLGAIAQQIPGTTGCAAAIRYSAVWSTRLPQAFPLYPDAAVAEAAGNDANGCRLRIVSFQAAASPSRTLDWYAKRARAFGYSVERSGERVAGERGGALYVVYAQPHDGGGSDVDLIVSGD